MFLGKSNIKSFLLNLKTTYQLLTTRPKICLEKVDYNEYWKNRRKRGPGVPNSFQRFRAEWIVKRIEEDSTVLDLGCGDGAVLLHMKKFKNFRAIGADISNYVLSFLESQDIHTIKLDLGSFDELEKLPQVDHILLLEVLEHMQNPEQFLKIIERKTKKSIFFSIPNTGFIAYRLRLLLGSFPVQWRIHPGEHIRFWTYRDLKWWLKELGYLQRAEIVVYEGIPGFNKIWPSLFGMGLLVKIKK